MRHAGHPVRCALQVIYQPQHANAEITPLRQHMRTIRLSSAALPNVGLLDKRGNHNDRGLRVLPKQWILKAIGQPATMPIGPQII